MWRPMTQSISWQKQATKRLNKKELDQYRFDKKDLEAFYGLPKRVVFCKRCVISNQRPSSTVEFKNNTAQKKTTIVFDDDGVCAACKYADIKEGEIDWG